MRRALGLGCLLALAGAPLWGVRTRTHAQDAPTVPSISAESSETEVDSATSPTETGADDPEREESPELRALRLAELEMFRGEQARVEISPTIPRLMRFAVPDALTSDAPAIGEHTGASGQARDLSWLEGLVLPDIPVRWDERVIRFLEFFRDEPRGQQLIRAWMRRTTRFEPLIRRVLREQGLPEDLLYIAMIESGFDPRARSDAGAIGLWQFVARTGREYGLTQSHWVDMRMDPEASTVAGARYLGALYRRLGTWELAFAAYNMGYGALLRSIRKYDSNDFWELAHLEAALPFETTIYVAKVTACAIVGRNPERFGLADLVPERAEPPDAVEVPGGTGLAPLARAAGVTVDELRQLNPALRRDRTPPGREPWTLRIPAGTRDTFARAWARQRPRDPVERSYVVRFGEDLGAIARRYRISEAALRELNQLDEGTRAEPGMALVVPAIAEAERVRVRGEAASEPPVIALPPGSFEYADRRRVFYRVQRSDRIDEIARFFRITVAELRQWNAIDPDAALHDGMFLQLFVPASVDLAQAIVLTPEEVRTLVIGSEEFYEWHVRQEGRVRLRYRVRSGDTLSSIAARFDLSVGSMARINQIGRDSVLRPGQELIVYTAPERVPADLRRAIEAEAREETVLDSEETQRETRETAEEASDEQAAPETAATETATPSPEPS